MRSRAQIEKGLNYWRKWLEIETDLFERTGRLIWSVHADFTKAKIRGLEEELRNI